MRSRGQATVEHVGLAVVLAVVVLGLGALLVRSGLAEAMALALARAVGVAEEPAPTEPVRVARVETLQLALAAVRGDAGAYSVAGARSLLAEDLGDADAARIVDAFLAAEFRRRHPAWFEPSIVPYVAPAPGKDLEWRVASVGLGAPTTHVVTPAEEAEAGLPGDPGGWRAVVASLAEDTLEYVAGRVGRAVGVAVDVRSIVLAGDVDAPDRAPPGERAGDVVVCRRHVVAVQQEGRELTVQWQGIRVAVLRRGQLVRDTLVDRASCA